MGLSFSPYGPLWSSFLGPIFKNKLFKSLKYAILCTAPQVIWMKVSAEI